jgi:hypothetical protein
MAADLREAVGDLQLWIKDMDVGAEFVGPGRRLPASVAGLLQAKPQLQAAVTQVRWEWAREKCILPFLSPAVRANLLLCSGPDSGLWVTAIPSRNETALTPEEFMVAARSRLRLPRLVGGVLPLSGCFHHHQGTWEHLESCRCLVRHDELKRLVSRILRMGGMRDVREEVPVGGGRKVDNLFRLPGDGGSQAFALDVAVVTLTGRRAGKRVRHPLSLCDAKDAQKCRRYKEHLASLPNPIKFVPCSFTSTGGMGRGMSYIISILAKACGDRHDWDDVAFNARRFKQLVRLLLSVAAVRGTARMVLDCLARATEAVHGSRGSSRNLPAVRSSALAPPLPDFASDPSPPASDAGTESGEDDEDSPTGATLSAVGVAAPARGAAALAARFLRSLGMHGLGSVGVGGTG